MDVAPPGSSVHGILQARTLEWTAISPSKGSSQPRDWTQVSYVSCTGGRVLFWMQLVKGLWSIQTAPGCPAAKRISPWAQLWPIRDTLNGKLLWDQSSSCSSPYSQYHTYPDSMQVPVITSSKRLRRKGTLYRGEQKRTHRYWLKKNKSIRLPWKAFTHEHQEEAWLRSLKEKALK